MPIAKPESSVSPFEAARQSQFPQPSIPIPIGLCQPSASSQPSRPQPTQATGPPQRLPKPQVPCKPVVAKPEGLQGVKRVTEENILAKQPFPIEPPSISAIQPEVDKLLAPLDSILNDAQELSSILSTGKKSREEKPKPIPQEKPSPEEPPQEKPIIEDTFREKPKPPEKPRERPMLISVESEDEPDVKRVLPICEDQMQYTLTIRQTPGSTASDVDTAKLIEALVSGDELPAGMKFNEDIDVLREQTKRHFNALEQRRSLEMTNAIVGELRPIFVSYIMQEQG